MFSLLKFGVVQLLPLALQHPGQLQSSEISSTRAANQEHSSKEEEVIYLVISDVFVLISNTKVGQSKPASLSERHKTN